MSESGGETSFAIGSTNLLYLALSGALAGAIMLVIGLAISLLFVYLGKKVDIEE